MRLGQLARSLDISIKDIVSYLSDNGIEVKDHPNSKLSDENEQDVISHFSPEASLQVVENITTETSIDIDPVSIENEEPSKEEEVQEAAVEEEEVEQIEATAVAEEVVAKEDDSALSVSEEGENSEEGYYDNLEGIDLIKAPKIELPGLKVVGKIELPQPKPKAEPEPEDELVSEDSANEEKPAEISEEEKAPEVRYYKHERKPKHRKPQKRQPLTEEQKEAKRIRNKKAKEKRDKEREEREKARLEQEAKQRKKQHYHEKLKTSTSNGQKTKKKKAVSRSDNYNKKSTEKQPKGVFGKFWKWLNT